MGTKQELIRRFEGVRGRMLIRQIERFLRETGMPWTKFGRLAAHDPRFVEDLRNGRIPRRATQTRIEQFMSSYQEHRHAN